MIEPSPFEPSVFVEQLLQIPTLHEVAVFLERYLPLSLSPSDQAPLLEELRRYGHRSDKAWHIVMATARVTPEVAAVGWHTYGRSLHKDPKPKTEPLIVATTAYRWAGEYLWSARAAIGLSTRLYVQSEYADAIRYGKAAIAILEDLADQDAWAYIAALITTAASYADQTSHHSAEGARSLCERAIAVALEALDKQGLDQATRNQITSVLVDSYITMGRVCEECLDDLRGAEDYYGKAADVLAAASPDHMPGQRFRLALNTAVLALRFGRHATATKQLSFAEQFLEAEDYLDAAEIALYRLYQSVTLGDYAGAAEYLAELNQLLAQVNKDLPTPLPRTALQHARASIFAAQIPQDDSASSEELRARYAQLRATLAGARMILKQDRVQLDAVLALIEEARVAYLAQDVAGARVLIAEARLEIQSHQLPRRALELEGIYALHDPSVPAIDLSKLIRQLTKAGDHVTAAALSTRLGSLLEKSGDPRRALRAYKRAIKAIDRAHRLFFRVTYQNIHFFTNRRVPFERAFTLLVDQYAVDAFMVVERVKAQAIAMEMHTHDAVRTVLERHPRLKQIHDLRLALEYNHPPRSPFNVSALDRRMPLTTTEYSSRASLERAYEQALMELQSDNDHEIDEATWLAMQPLPVERIQEILTPETALLSYFVVETPALGSELWVSVVTYDKVTVTQAISQEDFKDVLKSWNEHRRQQTLEPSTDQGIKGVADIPTAQLLLQTLNDFVVAPALRAIAETNIHHLIILSDEALPPLPLHAAYNRRQGYLIERYSVSYAPNATVLHHCHQREQQRASSEEILVAGWEHDVPSIKEGLEIVAGHLDVTYAHNSLTKAELLAQLPNARLVYLAAHGIFDEESYSRFSRLQLHRKATEAKDVVIREELSAHDLYSLQLKADLFVLNACHLGKHDDNFQGMTSAALVAGASSVVAGMWAVYAESAPRFMDVFYRELQQAGVTRAEALRQAQLAFIRNNPDPNLAHPAYWAPFFITGVATLPFRFPVGG